MLALHCKQKMNLSLPLLCGALYLDSLSCSHSMNLLILKTSNIEVIETDLLDPNSLEKIPKDVEGAYYLVHSMSSSSNYENLEKD